MATSSHRSRENSIESSGFSYRSALLLEIRSTRAFLKAASFVLARVIDCHLHYPETDIIAANGEQRLEWLEMYAFPTENEFSNEKKSSRPTCRCTGYEGIIRAGCYCF